MQRQIEAHPCPLSQPITGDGDRAIVGFDEGTGDGEPEAGPTHQSLVTN